MKPEEVIIVGSAEKDQYGNLQVTDSNGNIIRINKKHENLHPLFTDNIGRALKLTWDNYKGKDFVNDAELFDGKPPVEKQIKPITAGVEKVDTGAGQPLPIRKNPQNRSFALSYAKDVACAIITQGKEASVEKTIDIARKFQAYLDE